MIDTSQYYPILLNISQYYKSTIKISLKLYLANSSKVFIISFLHGYEENVLLERLFLDCSKLRKITDC
jgi:hypothetical protein